MPRTSMRTTSAERVKVEPSPDEGLPSIGVAWAPDRMGMILSHRIARAELLRVAALLEEKSEGERWVVSPVFVGALLEDRRLGGRLTIEPARGAAEVMRAYRLLESVARTM